MADEQSGGGIRLSGPLLRFVTVVFGIAAGYFLTIQSLKIELAAKAEAAVVETLDKKLAGFEVILKQGVVDKETFYRFSKEIEARLTRIEYHLTNKSGENIGNNQSSSGIYRPSDDQSHR
jgi:hypothetical protein